MKFSILIVLLVFTLPLISQTSLAKEDDNGRTERQQAQKAPVIQETAPAATARNADEEIQEGHDKDEGVYEAGGELKKQLEENGLIPASTLNEIMDKLTAMEDEIKRLRLNNDQLQAENNTVKRSLGSCCSNSVIGEEEALHAFLLQNAPNPFSQSTELNFFLPSKADNARIQIRDLNGEVLKTYEVQQRGQGRLTLEKNDLPSGSYIYSLYVDGKIIDSKVMILTR